LAISTDSVYAHKVFTEISPSARQVEYPLVSDRNHAISKAYGVLDEKSGATYRATFIIDPDGIVVSKLIYPKEVGRNIDEIIRLIEGIQYGRMTGLGIPANWQPGDPALNRDFRWVGRI